MSIDLGRESRRRPFPPSSPQAVWMTAGGDHVSGDLLECVVNVSEGRDDAVIVGLIGAAGEALLDVHRDVDHNRSVLTLAGAPGTVEEAVRRLARSVVDNVDLRRHTGAHPRMGALDVVPWVHLTPGAGGRLHDGSMAPAVAARDRFARWAAEALELPSFVYGPAAHGPDRTLPDLRREAWTGLQPDDGPARPHPSAGAVCVGARPTLVAYNLWLERPDPVLARRVAREIRSPRLRTLGLTVGDHVQVSCNLIAPWAVGPEAAFDAVASRAGVRRAELVGLLPVAVLEAVPSARWTLLDLAPSQTIEARLGGAGLDGGRFGPRGPGSQ